MIDRADLDKDGLVSEEEFYNVITKKTFRWVGKKWFSMRLIYSVLYTLMKGFLFLSISGFPFKKGFVDF